MPASSDLQRFQGLPGGDLLAVTGLRSVLVVSALVLSAGCSLPLYNRTARIAKLTFDGDWHPFDSDVYEAAIRTRFPEGTAFTELETFVGRLKGECHERGSQPGVMWCEIPVRGGFCWAQMLGFEVTTEAELITGLKVHSGGISC